MTLARAGAAIAAGGLVLGLTAVPTSAQVEPASPLQVSGTATCEVWEGEYVWVVEYVAENLVDPEPILTAVPAAFGDIDITSAPITLNGDVVGAGNFDPNPVPAGGSATDGGTIPGAITGSLVLTVNWTASTIEDSGTEVVTLTLDDTCHAPVTTTTQGPAVQAEAVAVTPAFTG
jgi:hypothetical protein